MQDLTLFLSRLTFAAAVAAVFFAATIAALVVLPSGAARQIARGNGRIVFERAPRTGPRPYRYELFTMRPDGSGLHQLTHSRFGDVHPRFSPGGSRIAFTRLTDDRGDSGVLYVMRANGSHVAPLGGGRPVAGDFPSWSPDGSAVAFVRRAFTAKARVYVMNLKRRSVRVLRRGPVPAGRPAWAPDGKTILVPGGSGLLAVPLNGSRPRRIGPANRITPVVAEPAWSKNGRRIAVVEDDGGCGSSCERYGIYVVSPRRSGSHRLVEGGLSPAWAPNGQWLLYVPEFDTPDHLFALNLSTGASTDLTGSGVVADGHPDWQPSP